MDGVSGTSMSQQEIDRIIQEEMHRQTPSPVTPLIHVSHPNVPTGTGTGAGGGVDNPVFTIEDAESDLPSRLSTSSGHLDDLLESSSSPVSFVSMPRRGSLSPYMSSRADTNSLTVPNGKGMY